MNYQEEEEENIKVILIGDSGVGKTNLINVSSGGAFNENEKSSLTASYLKKVITINNEKYTLSLWDTIGQEKLRSLSKLFFKNSKIVIYVYDITNLESFNGLESWNKDVKEMVGDDDTIIKAIVGNKQDLYLSEKVSEDTALNYASTLNAKFKLTSAKTDPKGFNSFNEELLKDYIDKNLKNKNEDKKDGKSMKLKKKEEDKEEKKKKFC